MRKTIDFMKTHPLFTGTFAVALSVASIKILNPDARLLPMALLRVLIIFAVSMCIYLISGTKAFEKCHTTTGFILKWNVLVMVLEIFLFISNVFLIVSGHNPPVAEWPSRLVGAVVLFFTVGLVEELTFRVAINDALLYQFRNSKHIFFWIAVISSFVFGVVHVIGANVFESPMVFATSMLKLTSTAVSGLFWLILYWKTRNIFGIAVGHYLYDLITAGLSLLTQETAQVGGAENYAGGGPVAAGFFALQTVLEAIAVIILWKKVGKTIDFDEIRKTW